MIPTPHITAKEGDFARTVLMPGDPLRSKFIAETFLENPVLVNNVRGVQGYTCLLYTSGGFLHGRILSHLKGVIRERMQLRERNLNNYFPVSYTHLDVYKRQVYFQRHIGLSAQLTHAGGQPIVK